VTVSAIIPALNEAETIETIILTLKEHPAIDEVIVVSDGSTDDTASIAKACGATVIELTENRGKGAAMVIGAQQARGTVLLFLDADLLALTTEHIWRMVTPLLEGRTKMTVGVFDDGRLLTDLALTLAPWLSGQRALSRELFFSFEGLDQVGYGVEAAIAKYVADEDIPVLKVPLSGLSHRMKEEKQGLKKGVPARFKMYWEIARCVVSDQFK